MIYNSEFHCHKCKLRTSQETRDRKKACSKLSDKDIFQVDNKVFYKLCPANYWNAASQEIIGLYSKFEKGLLPFTGGLLDQPAKFIEVMGLVESLTLKYQDELAKKANKKWQKTRSK